jgi:hypothetical protein
MVHLLSPFSHLSLSKLVVCGGGKCRQCGGPSSSAARFVYFGAPAACGRSRPSRPPKTVPVGLQPRDPNERELS